MHLEELDIPLSRIRGIGPAYQKSLGACGVRTVRDLLWHLPRDWQDRSRRVPLSAARHPAQAGPPGSGGAAAEPAPVWICTEAVVAGHDYFGHGAGKTLKVLIDDGTAEAWLVCFGRAFLARQLPVGCRIAVCGQAQYRFRELQLGNFEFELRRPAPGEAAGDGAGGDSPAALARAALGGTAMASIAEPPAGGGQTAAAAIASAPAIAPPPAQPRSDFDRILPVYPLSGELTQGFFRKTLGLAMDNYGRLVDEFLPAALLERHGFVGRARAFAGLHAPASQAELAESRRRLVYEELLILQLQVAQRSLERRRCAPAAAGSRQPPAAELPGGTIGPGLPGSSAAPAVAPAAESPDPAAPWDDPSIARWPPSLRRLAASLPFRLTPGQVAAVDDILADLDKDWTMSRLIQGDVGSGKTLVCLLACLAVIDRGGQAALMVPTVLLARQHAEKAASLLAPLGVQVALLAGSLGAASRRNLLEAVADGTVQLVVGTHALFGAELRYRRLELTVIDEQHRFGVLQRQAMHQKARRPNLLMMSATPIPQTMALTVFGDMEVSSIRSLPASRKPIETHLARMGNEQKVYEWVRRELARGRQAYFVYPLIDETGETREPGAEPAAADRAGPASGGPEGENRELKNAEAMFRRLAGEIFPEWPAGMIHSKMPEESKESVMEQFAGGQLKVLVATSVVEVGVDVPNASCMVIEHCERFGLAALHQLRGRVGRGEAQSYCFLVYREPLTEVAIRRLKILKESADGFLIAEEDLAIRGPGDIKGLEQSGFMRLRIADLARDMAVMNQARADAFGLLEADPALEQADNAALRRVLELVRREEAAAETSRGRAD
jgi:ATP-dependent DNA helicase RecG